MKQSFSFARVWLMLRRDGIEGRAAWLTRLLAIGASLGVFGLIVSLSHYSPMSDAASNIAATNDTVETIYGIFMFFYVAYGIGSINNRLASRVARTSWLMLPATVAEKYVYLLVKAFVVIPLQAVCSVVAAEVVRLLSYSLVRGTETVACVSPVMMPFVGSWGDAAAWLMTAMVLSFFFFGAFLFRRRAFFKSALIGFVLSVVFVLLSMGVVMGYFRLACDIVLPFHGNMTYDDTFGGALLPEAYTLVMMSLTTLFFLLWPYWRLKEMEL